MAIIKNECEIGVKSGNGTDHTQKEENKATKDKESNKSTFPSPDGSEQKRLDDAEPAHRDEDITESSKLLKHATKDTLSPNGSSFKKDEETKSNRKKSPSRITSNFLPEEASPLLKQKQIQSNPTHYEGARGRGGSFRAKPTVLYATNSGEGGRPASIAISSSELEPTYPWDYDQDNDDGGDNSSCHSDVFAGVVRGEDRHRMYRGSNDEYQHPSLENRK